MIEPSAGVRVRAAGGSDIGQERADNEDAWLCETARRLFIVADGMGGHAAGEQASAAAIRSLDASLTPERLRTALNEGEEAIQALLTAALVETNETILRLAEERPEWHGMGTTAVIAIIDGSLLYVANVGDSRAYLQRGKGVDILTRDHSVAATLVENEMITPEQLREHPMRNQLTMVLGSHQPLNPAFTVRDLFPGDRLLLCTDGLWDMVEDSDIAGILCFSTDPPEAVYSLIASADDAGGYDNITAVVVFI